MPFFALTSRSRGKPSSLGKTRGKMWYGFFDRRSNPRAPERRHLLWLPLGPSILSVFSSTWIPVQNVSYFVKMKWSWCSLTFKGKHYQDWFPMRLWNKPNNTIIPICSPFPFGYRIMFENFCCTLMYRWKRGKFPMVRTKLQNWDITVVWGKEEGQERLLQSITQRKVILRFLGT